VAGPVALLAVRTEAGHNDLDRQPSHLAGSCPGQMADIIRAVQLPYSSPYLTGDKSMTDTPNVLSDLSRAVTDRAAAAQAALVAIRAAHGRHLTGTLWRGDLVVASEQALPKGDEFQVIAPDGPSIAAQLAGRDPGTNVALLKLSRSVSLAPAPAGEARVGMLVLAFGADGAGGVTTRLGVVNQAGPEWSSARGGRIDRRIVLDMRLGLAEEGGPVVDPVGALLGISTLGPRGQVLVIPSATVERVIPPLLKDGRVARGWLGVALQPVAVPDALQGVAGQASGLMVMSTVEGGPAANAGIVPGDIMVAIDGEAVRRHRKIATRLGPDSIGRAADLRVIRGGAIVSVQATILARPPT
jgi:S1-C subfamily serine protease